MTDAGKLAVVVAHGELARGLVSAMESVLGPQPNVRWLSNTGKTPAALLADLETLVRAGRGRGLRRVPGTRATRLDLTPTAAAS